MCRVESHVRSWLESIRASQLEDGLVLPIPPPEELMEPTSAIQVNSAGDKFDVPSFYVSEEEAQEALIKSLSSHSCYGRSAAKNMDIYKILPYSAFHYTLETFCETRHIFLDHEPHAGHNLNNSCFAISQGHLPPHPWDIRCHPTQMFRNEVKSLEIPNTTSVTSCHSCTSTGWFKCHCCSGEGMKRCLNCCGSGRHLRTDHGGHRHPDSCWHCHGTGRKRCSLCYGDGKVVCKTCQGYRSLRRSVMLKVEFVNHTTDQVLENYDLPEEIAIRALGSTLYSETQPQVRPITCYSEDVFRLTRDTLHEHVQKTRESRVLMQRQHLRAIPVTECSYTWDDRDGRFWIFGTDLEVHAPDYPQKYCWGCSLL